MTYLNIKYDDKSEKVIINYSKSNPTIIFSKNCIFLYGLIEYKFYENYYTIQIYDGINITSSSTTYEYPLILNKDDDNDKYIQVVIKPNSNYLKFDSPNDNLKYFAIREIKNGIMNYTIVSFDNPNINIAINENDLQTNFKLLCDQFDMYGKTSINKYKINNFCSCYI